ncbi:MAG: glycosyltransferase family A protein [Pseudomonadota bacterium]
MTVSVVLRALNEEKWLDDALSACANQDLPEGTELELVLVDSGSTDRTLEIAKRHECQIFHIEKSEFTFGRSLNIGCEGASGEILVFISAHCIPQTKTWLRELISPLLDGKCDYVYGRQVGLEQVTRFSEHEVFEHYFGEESDLKQDGFFCNNANSALRRETWAKYRFDEAVTGLEDMVLAKLIHADNGQIGYVASAPVIHIHEETLQQVHRRYYREALTMRDILPEVHFRFTDFLWCLVSGISSDFRHAMRLNSFFKEAPGILGFRFMQFWGTYRGHNEHRVLSRAQKEEYYYPKAKRRKPRSASVSKLGPTQSSRH